MDASAAGVIVSVTLDCGYTGRLLVCVWVPEGSTLAHAPLLPALAVTSQLRERERD